VRVTPISPMAANIFKKARRDEGKKAEQENLF
jgi:hypothetical protein